MLKASQKPFELMVNSSKDQIEMGEPRGVLYMIPRQESEQQSYVGETGCQWKTRMKERMDDARLGEKEKSAVSRFVYNE